MPGFALTIFIGAFLLFEAQPLMAKYILPWFGGGPGVWTTCLLFFQVLLLGGYAYAHLLSRQLKLRPQVLVHAALLLAALLLLPITPADSWKPQGGGNPTLQILALLAASVGVPFFVLSSTSPLLQYWFSRTHSGAAPYRLYALSNAGSLLALISFPFFFEPHFSRRTQAQLWGWGLAVYALCCGWCALKIWRAGGDAEEKAEARQSEVEASRVSAAPGSPLRMLLWLLLPACASVLLLATTNKMCQDVAVIPFLWVLPLALYLLSFIICFDSPRWYARFPFTLGLVAASAGICWALFAGTDAPLYEQIGLYSGGLFLCCMVCHGELYRLRPGPRQLTGFYLMIAAGGALGGLFVAVVAPLVFPDYYELHWGLLLCGLLFIVCVASGERLAAGEKPTLPAAAPGETSTRSWRSLACVLTLAVFVGFDQWMARVSAHFKTIPKGCFLGLRGAVWAWLVLAVVIWLRRGKFRSFRHWRFVVCGWLSLGLIALGGLLWMQGRKSGSDTVFVARNFYGVLTVFEESRDDPKEHYLLLEHGRITHGLQFVDPAQAAWPTTYYGEESGVGLAIGALPARARRIGLVGLGAGTLSAYGRTNDYLRIYEINPAVRQLAATRFTYLANCPARVEVTLGDARLSMEREPPQNFDLLALDAFSSDAIPVHLLTREAFALYLRHLNPDGIIAVHISNHYLDLEPVVANLARQFGFGLATIDYEETDEAWWLYSSTWILLSRNQKVLDTPAIRAAATPAKPRPRNVPQWTDDFASLFQILRH